ncbi:MAG: hypothetical protein ACK54L_23775, partial [Betaproteobacteria bacterium]
VSVPAVPSTVPADVEWEARIEALLQLIRADPTRGREQAQQALAELRGQRLDLASRLTWLVAHSYLRDEKRVEAAVQLHRAIATAQTIRRTDLEADYLATLGAVNANMGAYSEAIDCYERALGLHQSLSRSAGNDLLPAKILGNFGTTFVWMGLPDKALPLYQQARDRFLRLGLDRDAATCLSNCANAQIELAERHARRTTIQADLEAIAAARAARELAFQALADPALASADYSSVNVRLIIVRA